MQDKEYTTHPIQTKLNRPPLPVDMVPYPRLTGSINDLAKLEMPFFFLPGNHDIISDTAIKIWAERFSSEQAYFHFVFKNLRWTFIVTHSPPHHSPTIGEKDPGNFPQIEALLGDRPFTVFSVHTHTYHYDQRDGREYITTATSGAMVVVRPGAMDHVVWVTMTKDGPKIINLLLNGMMDKHGPPEGDDMAEIGLYRPKA